MGSFYMLIGFPGSGKTSMIRNIIESNNIDMCDVMVLCRDMQVIQNIKDGMGKNKARGTAHSYIMDMIQNPIKKVIFYDSVNSDSLGRKSFLDAVPSNYKITLVYFTPCVLIVNKQYDMYVDWLHNIRPNHYIFPTDKKKAVETLENINKVFSMITQEESEKYNIIITKSYYDTIQ
jgi:hypothetical protein